MNFFILPSTRNIVETKINQLVKHLSVQPTVSFSKPIVKNVTNILNDNGKISKEEYFLNMIEVTIDNLQSDDFTLVATIFHHNGVMTKLNNEYFKLIPENFGANYMKCDFCGKQHKNRNESHVIYNPQTDKWLQVGTACINKMFTDGKYLTSFMVKLENIINKFGGGCNTRNYTEWVEKLKDTTFIKAVKIENIIPVITEYRKNNPNWIKGESTRQLTDFYYANEFENDESYNEKIFEFVKNLENTSNFVSDIKEAFNAEYINLYEIAKVFFAVKMYEDQFTVNDFEVDIKKNNILKGDKIKISGKIVQKIFVDNYDEYSYYCPYDMSYTEYHIKDEKTGLTFVSRASNIEKYKINDDECSFIATISGYSIKKQVVYLKGRLSKTPKTAYLAA